MYFIEYVGVVSSQLPGTERAVNVGCHHVCKNTASYKIDGSCDYCNGYCCRKNDVHTYCSEELMERYPNPEWVGHYCIIEIP